MAENEKATDARLGSEDKPDEPEEYPESEHATDTVKEYDTAGDRSKILIVGLIVVAGVVALIIVLLFLFKMLGGEGSAKFCPGSDLANRVTEGPNSECNQELTTP